MEILIGLVLALVVLWAWLAGHWFGRVLAFLVFAVILGLGGAILFAAIPGATTAAAGLGGIVGAALAWPVAGLPVYYERWQNARLLDGYRDAQF